MLLAVLESHSPPQRAFKRTITIKIVVAAASNRKAVRGLSLGVGGPASGRPNQRSIFPFRDTSMSDLRRTDPCAAGAELWLRVERASSSSGFHHPAIFALPMRADRDS
jgi:hypothetical protein